MGQPPNMLLLLLIERTEGIAYPSSAVELCGLPSAGSNPVPATCTHPVKQGPGWAGGGGVGGWGWGYSDSVWL